MLQKFTATVIKKDNLTSEIMILTVKVPDDFSFRAGQYVIFKLDDGQEVKPKAYSILSPEKECGSLRFLIKLVPDGFASKIFRKIKKNELLKAEGPFGRFTFSNDDLPEHWFIGCGSGLTPLYSLIKANLSAFPEKKIVLLFGEKTRKDLYFYDEFKEMEQKYPNFSYLPTLTREKWSGRTGRVQGHLPASFDDKTFYICGQKDLVLDLQKILREKGVVPESIRYERYS